METRDKDLLRAVIFLEVALLIIAKSKGLKTIVTLAITYTFFMLSMLT